MNEPQLSAGGGSDSSREEEDPQATAARHPPHVTENDDTAEVQEELSSPEPVPVLPANAGGTDKVNVSDQDIPIDSESMYDARPEQDKDHPASGRAGG